MGIDLKGGAAMGKKLNDSNRAILMEKVLELVRQNPRASFAELSRAAGFKSNRVWEWKATNLDGFADRYKQTLHEAFENLEGAAIQSLAELVDEKNFQAVKYTLDYCGYKPIEKAEIKNETTVINVTIDEGEE